MWVASSSPVKHNKKINKNRKKIKNNLFLVCSGGNTDSTTYTTASTTYTTTTTVSTNTQSGSNRQDGDSTTLIGEVN